MISMADLLLFGPILFVFAFGWIASELSIRSGRRYRESLRRADQQTNPRSIGAGPAE